MATVGNRVYLFGGRDSQRLFSDLFYFEVVGSDSAVGEFSIPERFSHSLTTYGQHLLIFGGCPHSRAGPEIIMVNTTSTEVSRIPVALPPGALPVRHTASVVRGGSVAAGGTIGGSTVGDRLLVLGGGAACFAFGSAFSPPFTIPLQGILQGKFGYASQQRQGQQQERQEQEQDQESQGGLGWVVLVPRRDGKRWKDELQTNGVLDKTRKPATVSPNASPEVSHVSASISGAAGDGGEFLLALPVCESAVRTVAAMAGVCMAASTVPTLLNLKAMQPSSSEDNQISATHLSLLSQLPARWERLGDMVVLPADAMLGEVWDRLGPELWQVVAEALGATRVARQAPVAPALTRDSRLQLLLGSSSWVEHRENGITYTFDAAKCMFSSGNGTEKQRIAALKLHDQEVVVDLFAGIGYFTIPLLVHARARHVFACEWNPAAVHGLRSSLAANQVSPDRYAVLEGDNRVVAPVGVADRVLLGLIPSSEASWRTAIRCLKPKEGGVAHVHGNVVDVEEQQWTDHVVWEFEKLAREEGRSWEVKAVHLERVKWYAPHIRHVVLDVCCKPKDLYLECSQRAAMFPPSIDRLTLLRSLRLEANAVTRLPDTLTSLQSLRSLELHAGRLEVLPSDLGNLLLLTSLKLHGCRSLASLPESFRQLANLNLLSLDFCSMMQLPASLTDLPSLTVLKIRGCNFPLPSPVDFPRLWRLESVCLEAVKGMRGLIEALEHLCRLKTLVIKRCSDITSLPESLFRLPSLTSLTLDMPQLSALPDHVGLLSKLRTLNLEMKELASLPCSIALVTTLQELSLDNLWNLPSLPEELGQLSALETLHLKNLCQHTRLPDSLGQLTALRELKIEECGQLQQLPDTLSQLSSLEHLEIETCTGLTALPDEMGNGLHRLRSLHLNRCSSLTHLPPTFSGLTSLQTLKIIKAKSFRGTLLDGFGCLKSLRELVLQHMPRLSALPDRVSGASSLTSLDILNCPKVTVLPEGIGRLEALEVVKIVRMDGLRDLPGSLVRLPCLRVLEVRACCGVGALLGDEVVHERTSSGSLAHSNRTCAFCTGAFSTGTSNTDTSSTGSDSRALLPSLASLKIKSVSCHALGPSLGQLPSLTKLKLLDMNFILSLPHSISQLSRLKILRIDSAIQLEALPDTFGGLSGLRVLKLVDLIALRQLPESFGQLKMLETLEIIDCYKLMKLPSSFANLSKLQSCILTKNGIRTFPVDFWKLASLQKLVLVGLQHMRSLPESFSKLPKLQVLRVTECHNLARLPTALGRMPTLREYDVRDCPFLPWRDERWAPARAQEGDGEEGEGVVVDAAGKGGEEEGGAEVEGKESGDVAGEGDEADSEAEEDAESCFENLQILHDYGRDSEDDRYVDEGGWGSSDEDEEEEEDDGDDEEDDEDDEDDEEDEEEEEEEEEDEEE
ncbi:unnamed protein product [Closterium sp. Yama58-4]|nr:unnamed protein product [Closterium sp. Yama58-4]